MSKVDFGLDFTTHIERVCGCQCEPCQGRGFHSIGNCEYSCHAMMDFNELQYVDNAEMHFECGCDCPFCRSAVVVARHSKMDCALNCYKSDFNVGRLGPEQE